MLCHCHQRNVKPHYQAGVFDHLSLHLSPSFFVNVFVDISLAAPTHPLCVPTRETLIPSSVVLGLGEAPLWSASSTYLTLAGQIQARQDHSRSQDIINQYFGILFLMYQSSGVWGNLLSSLVFGQDTASGADRHQLNSFQWLFTVDKIHTNCTSL